MGSDQEIPALKVPDEIECAALDAFPDPVVLLDGSGVVTWVNRAAALHPCGGCAIGISSKHLGQALPEVCRETQPWNAELAEQLQAAVGRILDGSSPGRNIDYKCPEQGDDAWFSLVLRPVNGRRGGLVMIHRNVTEQRRALREFAALEAECRLLEENMTDVICRHAMDGTYTYVSSACFPLFGYSPSELVGRKPHDFVHADDIEGLVARHQEYAANPELLRFRSSFRFRRKDGRYVWVETGFNFLRNPDTGTPESIVSVTRDYSEQRMTQAVVRRLATVVEQAAESIVITDKAGIIEYVNPYFTTVTGYQVEEVLGRTTNLLKSGFQEPGFYKRLWSTITAGNVFEGTFVNRRKDGTLFHEQATVFPIKNDDGEIVHFAAVKRDVSAQVQAERALRESEERYALATRGAADGIWDWNLSANKVFLAPRWREMLGYGAEDLGDSPEEWLTLLHADDRAQFEENVRRHAEGGPEHFECEYCIRHRDGTYRWMLCRGLAVRGADGRAYRLVGSQTDVTARNLAEEKILHNAFYDALTGLPNRALLLDRMDICIRRASRRSEARFAAIAVDLDKFKHINESFGHLRGDELLKQFAARIQGLSRPTDTLARTGEDEFVLLLDDFTDEHYVVRVAERVRAATEEAFEVAGASVYLTVSVGIAIGPGEYHRPEDLLRDAVTALFQAKSAGRDRIVVFDEAMHQRVVTRLEIESALHGATLRNEMVMHYQPIYALDTGAIVAVEALARWNHPQRGMLSPSEFIPVAEDTGLILSLGNWILRESCAQEARWRGAFGGQSIVKVNINLSARQLASPYIVDQMRAALEDTGADPANVRLEITESAFLENFDHAVSVARQLRALGVELAFDDFGTGYSSLNYLMQLPVQHLKLDKSFTQHIGRNLRDSLIVDALIVLANSLGITVTAEGVEREEQREWLRQHGCHFAQGFLFSQVVEPGRVEAMIRRELR
ncbi:MAG: EAL domain-containing protein [Candidatus Sumerlaeaceae bacterium]|nr:EAL domain-containing protein [Candidatus Sumerlaeaceae bacterium]